jgi:hypothetical protein
MEVSDRADVISAGVLVADTFCGPLDRLPEAGELLASFRRVGAGASRIGAPWLHVRRSIAWMVRCIRTALQGNRLFFGDDARASQGRDRFGRGGLRAGDQGCRRAHGGLRAKAVRARRGDLAASLRW